MKKIILIGLIGILFLSMVYAYTPVPYYSANLTLTTGYTPVVYYSANLTLGEAITDSCSPSSPLTADYVYDCNDNCTNQYLNANGYNIDFENTGNFYLETNIDNVRNITRYTGCNITMGGGNITIIKNE